MSFSFTKLKENYPKSEQAELFNSMGGGWPDLIGKPNYENTCAIRMSLALSRSGQIIPANFKDHITGDGTNIIVKVETMFRFFEETFKQDSWGISNCANLTLKDLPRKTGIIIYKFATPGTGGATGHIDLWDSTKFVGKGNLSDLKQSKMVQLWYIA